MSVGALTDTLRETLALFDVAGAPRTTSEVADSLDIGRRSTYEQLERLVDHGRLETKKVGASARVWWRPPSRTELDGVDDPVESILDRDSFLKDVLDGAEAGVVVVDDDYRVAWINEATERYFGIDRACVLGRDIRTLVEERIAPTIEDSATFAETVLATYDDDADTEQFECHVTPDDGRAERWLEHRSKPLSGGEFDGGRVELYYDVTDRHESERRLEREQQILDEVLKTSPVGIAVVSPDGSIGRANDRMADLFGTTVAELVELSPEQRTLLDVDGSGIPFPERPVGRVFETGEPASDREVRIRGRDGRRRWVSIDAVPFSGAGGGRDRVIAVATDVTRLKEQTRQLERQRDDLESELEDVFDRISDGFYGLDDELRFTYVNERAESILDLEDVSAVGRDIRTLLPVEDRFEAVLTEALEEQKPVFFEDYSEPFDTWFVNAIYPSETGLSVYFRDVTDRKEREQELERYAGIIDAVGEPVYELDDDGRIRFVNEPFVDLLGYDESELLGEHVSIAVPERAIDRATEKLAALRADGATGSASLEYELRTGDGETIPVENRFTLLTDEQNRVRGSAGVIRDVTERKERERELEESERRYRTLVENVPNGGVGLFAEDLRFLTAGGELFEAGETRSDGAGGEPMAELLPEPLAERLRPKARAVFDGEASEFEIEYGGRVRSVQVLPVHNESETVFAGMMMSQDITGRVERERTLERQREELAALNNLNDIIRRITDAVIEQSTREEIESTVCSHLAEADSYEFAWIGDVDPASEAVRLRTEAGVEGYLDDVTISVDPDDDRSEGPTGRAFRTGTVQTTQNIHDDARYDPWRDAVGEYEFRSSAAIPIAHDGTRYGVLNVYADRPNAFEEQERAVIGRLGEVIGHAIAAAERKRALLSDDVVELEYRAGDVFDAFDVEPDGRIALENAIPAEDEEFLVYGSVSESAVEGLRALVDAHPNWSAVSVRDAEDGTARFKLRLTESPVFSLLASTGGTVEDAVIENGDCYLSVHVSPGVDVRETTRAVRETFPKARLLKRSQRTRPEKSADPAPNDPTADLTQRQRVALQAAYYDGYFDWPREHSGAEIAASLGVSPPTFHQHIRKAEQVVFDTLLGASDSG